MDDWYLDLVKRKRFVTPEGRQLRPDAGGGLHHGRNEDG